MVEKLETSGNTAGVTLKTIEELEGDVTSPEDQAYLDGMGEEARKTKRLGDEKTKELLARIAREEKEGRPDN